MSSENTNYARNVSVPIAKRHKTVCIGARKTVEDTLKIPSKEVAYPIPQGIRKLDSYSLCYYCKHYT